MKNKLELTILVLLTLYSFLLRFSGLSIENPFWVDEFSTAQQARLMNAYGLLYFSQNDYVVEHNNLLTHLLVAGSFLILGENVVAARLPMVIIGALIPVAFYLVLKQYLGKTRSLLTSLLIATSNFEILWSVQARSYVLIQLLSLISIYFLLITKHNRKSTFYGMLAIFLGLFTHKLFIFQFISILTIKLPEYFRFIRKHLKAITIFIIVSIWITIYVSYFSTILEAFQKQFLTITNNLWYYHSFLWRGYPLIMFFSAIGILKLASRNRRLAIFIILAILSNFIFITFFFVHYHTKYLFPIFHLLYILFSFGLFYVIDRIEFITKFNKFHLVDILVIIFIILNGYKYTYLPKNYYSMNSEMREVSNIDYDQIYLFAKEKTNRYDAKHYCFIDTWVDRARWYLGDDMIDIANFRWENSGPTKITTFFVDTDGYKYLPKSGQRPIRFISSTHDLSPYLNTCDKGFIFIDDSSLPADVIHYAEENFKKELYIDHFPLDDNPYSIWPATLYSWGFEDESKPVLQ